MNSLRSIVRVPFAFGVLALLMPLGGCWFSLGESGSRASSIEAAPSEPIDWPARDLTEVRAVSEATPRSLFDYRITDQTLASPEAIAGAEVPRYRILDNRLTDYGLLRVLEERYDDEIDRMFAGLFQGFAPNARFVSSSTLSSDEEVRYWVDTLIEVRDESPGTQRTFDDHRHRIRDGVGVFIPDPERKPSPRGIVLHYRGLISTSYEEAFVDRIVESDWLVIRIGTHTRIATPRDARYRQRLEERERRGQELVDEYRAGLDPDDALARYSVPAMKAINRQVDEELPMISKGFDLPDPAEAGAVGSAIARAVDDALAESAYAAEAALEHLFDAHPELQGLPIAVLGCSAGAITAPAVAARIRERFGDRLSAIVMIGGGADFMRIDRGTALKSSRRLRLFDEAGAEPTDDAWDAVHEAYVDTVRLDPIKLGPRLRDVPTLIIRAGFDRWVPASTGSELVRAFGKPDRDWHPGGHQTLFYFLEGRTPRVLRWLDRNTPEPDGPATVAP